MYTYIVGEEIVNNFINKEVAWILELNQHGSLEQL
jgi:hypothetical protein